MSRVTIKELTDLSIGEILDIEIHIGGRKFLLHGEADHTPVKNCLLLLTEAREHSVETLAHILLDKEETYKKNDSSEMPTQIILPDQI